MIAHTLQHWRTTALGILAGGFVALQGMPDLDQMTFRQIAIRFGVACAIAALGAASADAKQNPGVVVEAKPGDKTSPP